MMQSSRLHLLAAAALLALSGCASYRATGPTATASLTPTTGNLASNGHVTLTSDATGTAMVVNPVGGGVVTGVATMERFINGVARFDFTSTSIRVGNGPSSVVGLGLIVHRDPDDYTTQPTGNAGPRLACAVITRS